MLEFEVLVVKMSNWSWSLHEIDETDIESLLPFVFHLAKSQGGKSSAPIRRRRVYCDEPGGLG